MIQLFKYQKGRSFIDKKSCLNETCIKQFNCTVPNYYSETKLVLLKSDSEEQDKCHKCNNQRFCAVYECKMCEQKFCYYCLIDFSKRQLIQNLMTTTQPKPVAQRVKILNLAV